VKSSTSMAASTCGLFESRVRPGEQAKLSEQ
jgi:hypothetical protein